MFSATYAASAPFAGLLIDRIGLTRAVSLAVGVWSCAGIATGFTQGLSGLMGCRVVLGAAEAGGIPAAGKAIHQFLRRQERALGNAINQAGVSLGAIVAPPLATWIALTSGWRSAFVVTGILGLAWIPVVESFAARRLARIRPQSRNGAGLATSTRPPPLGLRAANALSMVGYSLWTNWTTPYLVDEHDLTLAAIRPATPGFRRCSRWRAASRRMALAAPDRARHARQAARAFASASAAAVLSLVLPRLPRRPRRRWTAGISLQLLRDLGLQRQHVHLPLDTFGGARAAFAISMLVSSYGARCSS